MNKRNQIQLFASDAIIENKFRGICKVAPRVGKCKITIDALNTVKKSLHVLIIAPRKEIFKDWKKEFNKWGLNLNIHIDFVWHNSLKKNKKFYNLIVCDEIHEYNINVLYELDERKNKGMRILGLTGTLDSDTAFTIKQIVGINTFFNYTIDEAIKDKIIADYKIICIGCELNNIDKSVLSGTKEKSFHQTEKQAYDYWNNRYTIARNNMRFNETRLPMNRRKNIIYNSQTKINVTKQIVDSVDRCIIFTAYQKVADTVGDSSFHSKSNKLNLEKFKLKEFNKLGVVSMVSMGVTIPDLKFAIFNQLKSGENTAIQQAMRAMNVDGGKIATIYVIYLKNTQDEVWMKSALKGFDSNKIEYIDKIEYEKQNIR